MKLRTVSIVDAEIAVRTRVLDDLSALPTSFGPRLDYRQTILRYHVDQQARSMVEEIFSDPDSTTPPDLVARLTEIMVEALKQEIFRAANS
jgi:hypothetical protein